MRSVELTLDVAGDAAVRAQWTALADAGLPSLAGHQGATNRPHVTLVAGPALEIADVVEPLAARARRLPPTVRLGGLLLFPASRGRVVLARAVVVDPALADLHRAVHGLVPGGTSHSLPGRWSPHVTIAMRLTPEQLAVAVTVLRATADGADVDEGVDLLGVGGMRFWNGDDRTVTEL